MCPIVAGVAQCVVVAGVMPYMEVLPLTVVGLRGRCAASLAYPVLAIHTGEMVLLVSLFTFC